MAARNKVFLFLLLSVLLLLETLLLFRLPSNPAGSTDFLVYWSASRLFLQGDSPYDREGLLALEVEQGWGGAEPVFYLNLPYTYLLLSPLAVLPFDLAATIWLALSPAFIGTAVLLIWSALAPGRGRWSGALALALAFGFSRVWHCILMGQVSILVFLSLAAFVFLVGSKRDWQAGVALALTTMKPHLLYLVLPLLFLDLIRLRRWRVLQGFLFTMAALLLLPTVLNPQWPRLYLSVLLGSRFSPQNYAYPTPTLHGLSQVYGVGLSGNLWLFVLPLMLFLGLRQKRVDLAVTISWGLIIGLPSAPYSWSTDQILLLLPLLQICNWVLSMDGASKILVAMSISLLYLYSFGVWLLCYQEPLFLVVPIAIGALFWYVNHKREPYS